MQFSEIFVPTLFLLAMLTLFRSFLILLIIPFSNAKEKSENAFTDQIIVIISQIIWITLMAFIVDALLVADGSQMKKRAPKFFANQLAAIKGVIKEIYYLLGGKRGFFGGKDKNILDVWYNKGLKPLFSGMTSLTTSTTAKSAAEQGAAALGDAVDSVLSTEAGQEKKNIKRFFSIINILCIIGIIYNVSTEGGKLAQGSLTEKLFAA